MSYLLENNSSTNKHEKPQSAGKWNPSVSCTKQNYWYRPTHARLHHYWLHIRIYGHPWLHKVYIQLISTQFNYSTVQSIGASEWPLTKNLRNGLYQNTLPADLLTGLGFQPWVWKVEILSNRSAVDKLMRHWGKTRRGKCLKTRLFYK
jgi:hypothetical protein